MAQNTRKSRVKTWILAVDPFASFNLKPTLKFVRDTASKAGAKVHAVYVLAPASLNWTGDFSGPWFKKYEPLAQEKLSQLLEGFEFEQNVVRCAESGIDGAVNALAKFAGKQKADCILISTHGRSGIERWAMGSFAESLILTSKIPVMVTNPSQNVPKQVRKILVPTDLAKNSEKFVIAMADYAKRMDAEVVLFYKQPDPLDPLVQQGVYSLGGGWVSVQNFIDDEVARKEKVLNSLELKLRKKKIRVSHVLDNSPADLVESIDRAARDTGADMVSLKTAAGSWTTKILGSVARGLVRHASVPVLVQR